MLHRHVRVIAKSALRAFWERFPDAEGPLLAWFREVEKEHWQSPADVKRKYRHASIVGDRVVFTPPLIIDEAETDEMLRRFRGALDDTWAEVRQEAA